jgi:hypothetical protein
MQPGAARFLAFAAPGAAFLVGLALALHARAGALGLGPRKVLPRAVTRQHQLLRKARKECRDATACYASRPDSKGRRKRCEETFTTRRAGVEALDEALDGLLLQHLERADDGSELLAELEEHTEDSRGRRQRLKTWWDAAAWAVPTSRKWRDFDPTRLRQLSDALSEHLGEDVTLQLPRQTRALLDADQLATECDHLSPTALPEAPF